MGLDNPLHIAFLLVILLMVFGAKRLPEMGKSLGTGMRGFKDALNPEPGDQKTHLLGEHQPAPVEDRLHQPAPDERQETLAA